MLTKKESKGKTIIVPVSGGKDSQMVLALACDKHGADNVRAVYQATGFDHPFTLTHLKYMSERYKVKVETSQSQRFKDIFELIKVMGFFPNSKARQCTKEFKLLAFQKWLRANKLMDNAHVYFGMRTDESAARAKKYTGFSPKDIFTLPDMSANYTPRYKNITVSLPVVNWATAKIFSYLEKRGDKVNPLYARGHSRVGCYPCLVGNQTEWVLASKDKVGRKNIAKLIELEDYLAIHGDPRRSIKIHQTRDIRRLLETNSFDVADSDSTSCATCSY